MLDIALSHSTYLVPKQPGTFEISGQNLVLQQSLDREQIASHFLIVAVEDNGFTRRQSTAEVRVTVLDVNDNAPVLTPTSLTVTVAEDTLPGVGK